MKISIHCALLVGLLGLATGHTAERPNVAVLEIQDASGAVLPQGGVARSFAKFLRQELGTRGTFSVIRTDVFGPQPEAAKLADPDTHDAALAVRLGKQMQAPLLLTGTIRAYEAQQGTRNQRPWLKGSPDEQIAKDGRLAVHLRLIDTRDGSVRLERELVGHSEAEISRLANAGAGDVSSGGGPGARAVRQAAIESADFLECELVRRDQCLAEYADPNLPPGESAAPAR